MEFIPSVKDAFNKYGTFSGRSSRSQYWWFFLFGIMAGLFFSILDFAILGVDATSTDPNEPIGWFNLLWSLFLIINRLKLNLVLTFFLLSPPILIFLIFRFSVISIFKLEQYQ